MILTTNSMLMDSKIDKPINSANVRHGSIPVISKMVISFVTMLMTIVAYGQSQKKYFYDKDWKGCSQSNAEYYRLITLDVNGKPCGKVRDYYMTGQIQWEGELSYFFSYDNSKDVMEGFCIWYHKNGQKSSEGMMVSGKQEGLTTFWDENGNKIRQVESKNGIANGIWQEYYSTGKLKSKGLFKDGLLT